VAWHRHNGGSRRRGQEAGGITIGHFEYLALMAACLLITLPLELVLGARVYRRFRLLVLAVLPVVLIFSVWDVVGIVREHWHYNPAYVTGVHLVLGMPLEELVFFVVIPVCGLLTYEAVGQVLARSRRMVERRRRLAERGRGGISSA
jgi:lycopene cyclase domain-containing protein